MFEISNISRRNSNENTEGQEILKYIYVIYLLVFLNKNLQYVIDIVTKNNFNGKYIIWLFN
jgi:hypothetical protein